MDLPKEANVVRVSIAKRRDGCCKIKKTGCFQNEEMKLQFAKERDRFCETKRNI